MHHASFASVSDCLQAVSKCHSLQMALISLVGHVQLGGGERRPMCRCVCAGAQTHVQLSGEGRRLMRRYVWEGADPCAGVWVEAQTHAQNRCFAGGCEDCWQLLPQRMELEYLRKIEQDTG